MEEGMDQIVYWFQEYYNDSIFLVLAIVSYIYLFVYEKKERKRFLYPIALLIFCVVNPLLYFLVFHQIIYWRLFWVIPNTLVVAYAVTKLVQASRKVKDKILVLGVILLLLGLNGKNVYQSVNFRMIQNPEKVGQGTKEVCDIMLELEESPRCILPMPMLCQARQYSGEIRSMYGRNVQGFILDANENQWGMYFEMEKGDVNFDYVFGQASALGYEFVVTYKKNEVEKSVLNVYNYREIGDLEHYRIYYSGENSLTETDAGT